jgi:protein-L-isoaspartate O-methyltransferase
LSARKRDRTQTLWIIFDDQAGGLPLLREQLSTKDPHEALRESLRIHRLWFIMNNVSGTKYILGHSPAEIQRLMSQAVMLRPITERLLRSAGIEPGMRVLDVGCGAGDVSMLAAELVGSTGSVIGIDRNEQVLAIARERTQMAKFRQIDFKEAATGTYSDPEPFDLVVGRYVLIH